MYSTCQVYVICQFKHDRKTGVKKLQHVHWEEIASSLLPSMNGWPKKTNCKVLWKLVQINLSSLRVIGTCSRLNTFTCSFKLSLCIHSRSGPAHTSNHVLRLTGGKCHMALRHPHSEDFHFPRQTSLILGKYRHLQANRYFWDWRKCFRQDWTYRRWVGLFLAWLSSQGFSLQGHSSFRIHSLVFVLTLLSEMLLIHSQYL